MSDNSRSARAIVSHVPTPAPSWKFEKVTVQPIKDDELLVEMVATGVCHTDILIGSMPREAGVSYPRVLGHEGAGYVKEIGSKVTIAKVGDPVLLSFTSCSDCIQCNRQHPAFCDKFALLNYFGEPNNFHGETATGGVYFGQSSFASLTAVRESSVVNASGLIKDREELKLFAPLGCGIQTGASSVIKLAGTTSEDTVAVLGLGGVGLAAVMAAKIKGVKTIIGVDRYDGRLDLAKSVGATHVVNTSSEPDFNLEKAIKDLTRGLGTTVTIDTTGNLKVIAGGIDATAIRGQFVFIGAPPFGSELPIKLQDILQSGKVLRGSIEGDAIPQEFVKEMIQWYRDGKLPIDKFIKYYKAEDFETALADMESGATVKPVLIW